MKKRIAVWLPLLMLLAAGPAALAQVTPKAPATKSQPAQSSGHRHAEEEHAGIH